MFGKTYNTIGSTDSNFIIKTKGDLKVQWGNKYIDIIKNGKIANSQESEQFLKKSEDINKETKNGIYLAGDDLWVVIDGTKIKLNEGGESYISFAIPQECDAAQKDLALTNIGFYYDSLEQAQDAQLQNGIFYIKNANKLYSVQKGIISEYTTSAGSQSNVNADSKQEHSLYIQDSVILLNGEEYIKCDDFINMYKKLILQEGLQSQDYSAEYGYALYMEEGKSYLVVDYITQRQQSNNETITVYSSHNNTIISKSYDDNTYEMTCTLSKTNKYKVGDFVYALLTNTITEEYNGGILTITIANSQDYDIKAIVSYNNVQSELIIPKGNTSASINIGTNDYEITYLNSGILTEFEVVGITNNDVILNVPSYLVQDFNNCIYLFASRKPYIHISDNNLDVYDRSLIYNEVPDNTIHSRIGIIEGIENQYNKELNSQVGIYSDNFVGINSKLFNTTFKALEEIEYPKYDIQLTIPENKDDEEYNQVVPNLQWVKELISVMIPKGTIVMWNGTSIPKGWAICDGKNGTPNLIGKFIKADNTAGITGGNNTVTLTEANLPNHKHTISKNTTEEAISNKHTHTVSDQIADTSEIDITDSTFTWKTVPNSEELDKLTDITTVKGINLKGLYEGDKYLDSTSSSSKHKHSVNISQTTTSEAAEENHTHDIPQHSTSNTPDAESKAFDIQPEYYSLIFIIKQ